MKERTYWSNEKCQFFANKCKTRSELKYTYPKSYDAAVRLKCLNSIFKKHKSNGFVSKLRGTLNEKEIQKILKKVSSRNELMTSYPVVYAKLVRENSLESVFQGKPNFGFSIDKVLGGHWNIKNNVLMAAKECSSRTELFKKYRGAYDSAKRHGWFDEAVKHMPIKGTRFNRFIYAITNAASKTIYIGLSYNPNVRFSKHISEGRSIIKSHIQQGAILQVLEGPLILDIAAKREEEEILKYRKEGWTVLNVSNGGQVGGNVSKYSYDKCKEKAFTCDTRRKFKFEYPNHYHYAEKHIWIDDFFKIKNNNGYLNRKNPGEKKYWNRERLQELVNKYKYRFTFAKYNKSASSSAIQMGILDELFNDHINNGYKHSAPGRWTFANVQEISKLCEYRMDLLKEYPGAYDAAVENRWLDKIYNIYPHKGFKTKQTEELSLEKIKKCANSLRYRSELKSSYKFYYTKAVRMKWLDEIFKDHLNKGYGAKRPPGTWNLITSSNAAKKCKSRSELKKKFWGAWNYLRLNSKLNIYYQ